MPNCLYTAFFCRVYASYRAVIIVISGVIVPCSYGFSLSLLCVLYDRYIETLKLVSFQIQKHGLLTFSGRIEKAAEVRKRRFFFVFLGGSLRRVLFCTFKELRALRRLSGRSSKVEHIHSVKLALQKDPGFQRAVKFSRIFYGHEVMRDELNSDIAQHELDLYTNYKLQGTGSNRCNNDDIKTIMNRNCCLGVFPRFALQVTLGKTYWLQSKVEHWEKLHFGIDDAFVGKKSGNRKNGRRGLRKRTERISWILWIRFPGFTIT